MLRYVEETTVFVIGKDESVGIFVWHDSWMGRRRRVEKEERKREERMGVPAMVAMKVVTWTTATWTTSSMREREKKDRAHGCPCD